MTKNLFETLAFAAFACVGASTLQAQTILQLSYPSGAPGAVPCLYTTNGAGISADPQSGNLLATGDFTTGCPQTGSALPLPVIVPGPINWQLPNPWSIGQVVGVQWAAVNAESCTYGGSNATGWPSTQSACSTQASCQTLHNVSLSPATSGQYQFLLTCTNTTGSTTSTSPFRTVSVDPPIITSGPTSWNVTPWTAGQTRAVIWSANNADNCNFTETTLPTGVTLNNFLSSGVSSCSSAGSCQQQNGLILNATVPGTYGVTLTCSKAGGGVATSTQNWTVTQSSSANCSSPAPGWFRVESGRVIFGSVTQYTSQSYDFTQFASLFGRAYSFAGSNAIVKQWPGVSNQMVVPELSMNQFVSAKFRTPNSSAVAGSRFVIDPTSYLLSGGDGISPIAKLSATVSTVCGDFDTGSQAIPAGCAFNQFGSNQSMPMFVGESGAQCRLQPNTDYYFNLIYSPLTSPASAVFNGFGIYSATLLQNLSVIEP